MTADNFRVLEKRGRGYDLVGNVWQWSEDSHRTTYTQRKGVLPMSYENIFPNTIHHLKKKSRFCAPSWLPKGRTGPGETTAPPRIMSISLAGQSGKLFPATPPTFSTTHRILIINPSLPFFFSLHFVKNHNLSIGPGQWRRWQKTIFLLFQHLFWGVSPNIHLPLTLLPPVHHTLSLV